MSLASSRCAGALCVFVAAASLLGGCRRTANVDVGGGAALMTNVMRSRALDVVVEERELVEPMTRAAARLARADESRRFTAVVRASSTDARTPRVVVGTAESAAARALAERAGIQVLRANAAGRSADAPSTSSSRAFRYGSQEFADPNDALIATFEDPERPGLPVTLVFANDARVAAITAGSLQPGWKPWIRILRAGDVTSSGPLDANGAPRAPDLARVGFARATSERELVTMSDPLPGMIGRASRDLGPERLASYLWSCVHARERAVGWCAPDTGIPAASVDLWSSTAGYLPHGDPDQLWRFDPVDEHVDALLLPRADGSAERGIDDGGAGVACAGIWNRLGAPAEPWMLDAAGVEAAWWWWGSDLDAWLARTSAAGADVTLARLVDASSERDVSAHVWVPRRAALWRFLRETRGDTFVRELWRGTRALDVDVAASNAFVAWLSAHVERGSASLSAMRSTRQASVAQLGALRGVGTCEPVSEGPRASREGYGSAAFLRTLTEAAESGADAVSITSFVRDVDAAPALFDDRRARSFVSREGDVRLVASLVESRTRGLRTMLVPHLLAGNGGSWSGTWTRSGRDDWRAFFERYARFVEHHALVAEIGDAAVLSLGSGAWAVTGGEPMGRRADPEEPAWRAEGWSRVIAAARASFDGRLVYSAGSPDELARVPFFGDLDFVGLELAPTLEYDDPWDGLDARAEIGRGIEAAFQQLQIVTRSSGKPALITQAAFSPDLHGAARALGSGSASSSWHAAQYRELAARLDAWKDRVAVAGVFAWRVGPASVAGEHDVRIDAPDVRTAVSELFQHVR